jgi:uncharacterized protein (TIGR01244 family)
MFRRLSEQVLVAGQIGPGDVAEAAASGIATIVNNRPDAEETGQPASAEIKAAAQAAGLAYHHIPVWGGIAADDVERMAAVLDEGATVLAFCRSGTRSTWLWALAESRRGADGGELIAQAAAAGYDLEPLRDHLG